MSLSARGPRSRRLTVLLTSLAVLLATAASGTFGTSTAQAAGRPTPGNFTGYGFDQCEAPSQEAMDAWLYSSPFWAVGIYIAGSNRACKEQRNLTPAWVETQLANGWRLLPITVGPQASCYSNPNKKIRIRTDPSNDYAAARQQAKSEAARTVTAAQALGIPAGSALWYDLEHATGLVENRRCRESTLHFLSAWTNAVHDLGYVSGVYAHLYSGVKILDQADANRPGRFTMPDYIWIARWDGKDSVEADPAYLRPTSWMPHGRVHQYLGDHVERHGGVSINIDSNYLSLGKGTRPGRAPVFCNGTQVDFASYPRLDLGAARPEVTALQCLLKRRGLYGGELGGVYDAATQEAVRRFQESAGLRVTGRMWRSTWTVMLAAGRTPVLKVGSGGNQVRRAQRSLNAATGAGLAVDGLFGHDTTAAVRTYQERVGLPRTGVVSPDTWARLQAGRL